jgi:succinyl-diaminopimelate desuccinylase
MLAERLAQRTLELVDVPSESRDEAAVTAHVLAVLQAGGVPVRDGGDTCLIAGELDAPGIVLAGHLDTVPAQDNLPGRIEDGAVHGLGAADMKGSDAVMVELALAGVPFTYVFFGREELPHAESALTPLLEREPALRSAELAIVMEPTSNTIHAGCLGNINARLTAHGAAATAQRPGPPRTRSTGSPGHRRDRGAAVRGLHVRGPGVHGGDVRRADRGAGIAQNVIPDRAVAHVNYRYAPGRTPNEAERHLHAICDPHGTLEVSSTRRRGRARGQPDRGAPAPRAAVGAKQAWTPVAEFAHAGVDAINFGPGEPRFAHTREERVSILALVKAYETLEDLSRPDSRGLTP